MHVLDELRRAKRSGHGLSRHSGIVDNWSLSKFKGRRRRGQIKGDLRFALGVVDWIDRSLEGLEPSIDVLEDARFLGPGCAWYDDIGALNELGMEGVDESDKPPLVASVTCIERCDQRPSGPIARIVSCQHHGTNARVLLQGVGERL